MFEDSKAFAPFFDQTIGYHGKRQDEVIDTNFIACVFPSDNIEAFSDLDSASDLVMMSISIRQEDWNLSNTKPMIGDVITLEDGTNFTVSKCGLHQHIYTIEARG